MDLVEYNKVKFIEVYGLRRSGNHAIINWIMNNTSNLKDGGSPTELISLFSDLIFTSYLGDTLHINDVASGWAIKRKYYLKGLIDGYISIGFKNIILSYEDLPFTNSYYDLDKNEYNFLKNSKKIIITRDIENVFASRVKKGMEINEGVFNTWVKNENAPSNITKVKFEDWLLSKNYRDRISKDIGFKNKDITNNVSKVGGGSSFKDITSENIDKDKLPNRKKEVEFPEDVLEILQREETQKLREKFGYI
jgi:hypothetical protein